MKKDVKGVASAIYFVIVFALSLLLVGLLSPEGSAGLWRKTVINILNTHVVGLFVVMLLEKIKKLYKYAVLQIIIWILAYAAAAVLSVPCYKDLTAEHAVIEVPTSSCGVFNCSKFSRCIRLDTGEEITISTDHYFQLLGARGTLRIEYYPNTMTAIDISGYV